MVAQALRAQARVSVFLLGCTPLYVAVGLAPRIGPVTTHDVLLAGHGLPFVVGVVGLVSLYRSFGRLAHVVPTTRRLRPGLPFRLTVGWGGFLAAVTPVAYVRCAWWLTAVAGG